MQRGGKRLEVRVFAGNHKRAVASLAIGAHIAQKARHMSYIFIGLRRLQLRIQERIQIGHLTTSHMNYGFAPGHDLAARVTACQWKRIEKDIKKVSPDVAVDKFVHNK